LPRAARQNVSAPIGARGDTIEECVDRIGRSCIQVIEDDLIRVCRKVVEYPAGIARRSRE
jgi:hypothetical protein